ncbi:hypothetical protein [Leptospira noguchii]|nr:hypothetical protein [Leptospira noguchii]
MLLTMDRSIIIAFAFVMPNSRYVMSRQNKKRIGETVKLSFKILENKTH